MRQMSVAQPLKFHITLTKCAKLRDRVRIPCASLSTIFETEGMQNTEYITVYKWISI